MLVVHIEQAVRQWYETSYYYLRPRGTTGSLWRHGVPWVCPDNWTGCWLTSVWSASHDYRQRTIQIVIIIHLPARANTGRNLPVQDLYGECMKIILLSPEGRWKDVPSWKSGKWNTISLSRPLSDDSAGPELSKVFSLFLWRTVQSRLPTGPDFPMTFLQRIFWMFASVNCIHSVRSDQLHSTYIQYAFSLFLTVNECLCL